jgi:ribA/ribD-fused uncharacterized protein
MKEYNLDWLLDEYESKDDLKFLFFWGHEDKLNKGVGKFCFSQWYQLPFTVDGVVYQTAEHWMMASKAILFNDTESFKKIISASKPGQVKALGREVRNFDEGIWNKYKLQIVKYGNIHKFNQHPAFAEYLVGTHNHVLVEASPVDITWGIGLAQDHEDANNPYCWRGENLLGFALMEVRDWLSVNGHFEYLQVPIGLPWLIHPEKDLGDLYWQMGKGEEMLFVFHQYYFSLSAKEKEVFKIMYILPCNWQEALD